MPVAEPGSGPGPSSVMVMMRRPLSRVPRTSTRPGPGRVDVRGTRDNGRLIITITDDGPGPEPGSATGIGIANTRERLVQLYGESGRLTLGPGNGGGARVSVSLPWRP